MRRPRKKPSLVVFCLIFAVSPCSEVFRGSSCFKDVSWAIFGSLPPGPLGDRLAGGAGGIWLLMSLLLSARIGMDCPSIERLTLTTFHPSRCSLQESFHSRPIFADAGRSPYVIDQRRSCVF